VNTIYKQTTADTCLPSCLIMMLDEKRLIKSNQKLELEILVEGDKLSRENRTIGHLLYVCRKYSLSANYYASQGETIKSAEKVLLNSGIQKVEISKRIIDAQSIQALLKQGEAITCIDDYTLREQIHFPHFVVIENFESNKFSLVDPWEGKRFLLTSEEMENAFEMLDKLNFPREVLLFR
jgi:hypothetical protein